MSNERQAFITLSKKHINKLSNSKWCQETIKIRKKILAIPEVAASERGGAQTIDVYINGVVGQWLHLVEESYKSV